MRAYSLDLRQRALAALARGMARHEVVVTFGVSLATLKRWLRLQRTAASLTPKTAPGRRRAIPVEQQAALWAQLEAYPDTTLAQHTQRWNATHGVARSYRPLGRAIQRLGWTRTKRRWVPLSGMNKPELRSEIT
jgi:transposase